MPLTDEEKAQLDALIAKDKEPEPAGKSGPNVEVYVDLSDESAVERAIGFGLLTKADIARVEDDGKPDPEDDTDDGKGKPAPRRRGYFKDEAEK